MSRATATKSLPHTTSSLTFHPMTQAMIRLMQMLSNSEAQAECNDIECFAPNDPNSPSNVLSSVAGGPSAQLATYLPMLMVWAAFVMLLFFLRPGSMRRREPQLKAASPNTSNRPRFHDHDDDDAFAN